MKNNSPQRLVGGVDSPDTDEVVSVSGVQDAAVGRPAEGRAVRGDGAVALADGLESDLELLDLVLGFKIPDLDAVLGGGAEPVAARGEDEAVDDVSSVKGVEHAALVEVPEHGLTVLTARSAERSVGGDGDGVEVAGVLSKVADQEAGLEVPHLNKAIPTGRDDEGVGVGGREADAGHPLGVAAVGHGELALAQGVPKLDGLVAGARNDLAVVAGEGNGEDVLGVANESAGGLTLLDVPKAESTVPGAGERELTVRGDHDVGDVVGVASKAAARSAVAADVGTVNVVALLGKIPDDDRAIAGGREDHVGVDRGGGDSRDPVGVAAKLTAKRDVCHDETKGEKKKKEEEEIRGLDSNAKNTEDRQTTNKPHAQKT